MIDISEANFLEYLIEFKEKNGSPKFWVFGYKDLLMLKDKVATFRDTGLLCGLQVKSSGLIDGFCLIKDVRFNELQIR